MLRIVKLTVTTSTFIIVGIYLIRNFDAKHKFNLFLTFNGGNKVQLPSYTINTEEFLEILDSESTSLQEKNCLPEPLPISELTFSVSKLELNIPNKTQNIYLMLIPAFY